MTGPIPPKVRRAAKPVHSLPGALVRDRRAALCQLTHDELLALYAATIARRTRLSDTVLIDLLVWQQSGREG